MTKQNEEREATPKESPRIHDARGTHQGAVHLLIGPVGAGKSTHARHLAHELGAVRLTLDDWMTRLFRPDRPDDGVVAWYAERAARCVGQIWRVTREVATTGTDVVLEIGLIRRRERERFYRDVDAAGIGLTIHVLDAARGVRRERVLRRNRARGDTFAMVVPPDIFELASDMWEPPDDDERAGRRMRFLRTDGCATRER